jgi:hypothetical protein
MPGTQPDNRPALDRTKQTRNAFTGGEPPTEAEFNTVVNNYNTLIDRHMTLLTAVNRIHRMLAVASTALSRRMRGENSR